MEDFTRAFEAGDVDAVVAMLTDDAWLTMPPLPLEYHGLNAVRHFLATVALRNDRPHVLIPTRANGQPAFGCYLRDPRSFCVFASLYGTLFFLAQYLQTVLGHGPLGAGLRLMPWTATLMVCAPIAGRLADKVGEQRFVVGGLLLQTIGSGWIAVVADTDTAGFAAAMGAVAAFAFIGMLVALGMPGSRPATITAPPQATTAVHQRESAES